MKNWLPFLLALLLLVPPGASQLFTQSTPETALVPGTPTSARPTREGNALVFPLTNSPVHSLRVAFPADDTVRLTYDAGADRPLDSLVRPHVSSGRHKTTVRTDTLTFEVDHAPFAWRLYNADHRFVTGSGAKPVDKSSDELWKSHWMPEYRTDVVETSLKVSEGTHYYGLGQRFNVPQQAGWVLRSWICDCAQDGNYAEKGMGYFTIPFFWTEHGWGAFVNSTADIEWDLGASERDEAQIRDPSGQPFDLYLFARGSPRGVLEAYADIVGHPNLPPKWAFEQWVDGVYGNEAGDIKGGEAAMRDYLAHLESARIPVRSVVVEDWTTLWWFGARWVWDPAMFPDPAGFIQDLHSKGLKVMVWETPSISPANTEWGEAAAKGYFAKDSSGAPYVVTPENSGALTWWMQGVSVVDFTNPEARAWWREKHQPLLDLGIDGYKADGGEEPVPEMHFLDGTTGITRHNSNAALYNQALYDDLVEVRGEGAMISRSGGLGSHLASGIWNGDQNSGFAFLRRNVIAALANSNSGLPWSTFDQGGLTGTMDREEFLRQMQANVFGSWFKMHLTWDHPRAPWDYDAAATDTYRYYTELRLQLLDYIHAQAGTTAATGIPLTRALAVDFPEDPAVLDLFDEFLLGDQLLVAPQLEKGATARDIHLPAGSWIDVATGERHLGPLDLKGYSTPQELLPLFWREGGTFETPTPPPHPALPPGWSSGAVAVAPPVPGPDEYWSASGTIEGPVAAKNALSGTVGDSVFFDVPTTPAGRGWIHITWNAGVSKAWLQENYLHFSIRAPDGRLIAQCDGGAEILCWIDHWPMTGRWEARMEAWTGEEIHWEMTGFIPH